MSLHHARIAKIQSLFYIEDLGSTNSTFVNERPTDEQPLTPGDQIRIGNQVLIFEQTAADGTDALTEPLDETVVLTPRQPAIGPKVTLLVIDGRTDQTQYQLSGPVAVIGSDAHATVKLKGWFAPRVAAQFNRHPSGYAVQPGPDQKELRVNGQSVDTSALLKDGDVIEVAGVKLSFYVQTQTQNSVSGL